ncbi:hypothetical protein XENORESO_008827 [Xenotaenia resolanae]|uniref:Uncharacterized protein n=1 Tax=Xenotaenia resolanae TaxID=208358 RepID=A0ABV0VQD7_9TELE
MHSKEIHSDTLVSTDGGFTRFHQPEPHLLLDFRDLFFETYQILSHANASDKPSMSFKDVPGQNARVMTWLPAFQSTKPFILGHCSGRMELKVWCMPLKMFTSDC